MLLQGLVLNLSELFFYQYSKIGSLCESYIYKIFLSNDSIWLPVYLYHEFSLLVAGVEKSLKMGLRSHTNKYISTYALNFWRAHFIWKNFILFFSAVAVDKNNSETCSHDHERIIKLRRKTTWGALWCIHLILDVRLSKWMRTVSFCFPLSYYINYCQKLCLKLISQ